MLPRLGKWRSSIFCKLTCARSGCISCAHNEGFTFRCLINTDESKEEEEKAESQRRRRKVGLPQGETKFRLPSRRPFVELWYVSDLFKTKVGTGMMPTIQKIECANFALSGMHLLGPGTMSNIILACKRGAFIHRGLLSAVGSRILSYKAILESFSDVQISMVVSSLGTLEKIRGEQMVGGTHPPSETGAKELFSGCNDVVHALVSEFTSRGTLEERGAGVRCIANMVHGLGWLYKDTPTTETDHDLLELVEDLLSMLFEDDGVRKSSVYELVLTLHGLARVGYKKVNVIERLCHEIRSLLLLKRIKPSVEMLQAMQDRRKAGVDMQDMCQLGINEAAMLMWSLGKLEYRWDELLEAVGLEIGAQASNMNPAHICAIMLGMAELQYPIRRVFDAVSGELIAEGKLEKFHDHALASLTYSFARLGYRNEVVLHALARITATRIMDTADEYVLHILVSWGKMGHKSSIIALEAIGFKYVIWGRIPALSTESLVGLTTGLGENWFNRAQVVECLATEVKIRAQQRAFLAGHLGSLITAFAKLGSKDENLFWLLCVPAQNLLVVNKWPLGESIQVLQGLGWWYTMTAADFEALNDPLIVPLLQCLLAEREIPGPMLLTGFKGIALLAPHLWASSVDHSLVKRALKWLSRMIQMPQYLDSLRGWQTGALCWMLAQIRYYDSDLLNCLIDQSLRKSFQGTKVRDDIAMIMYACAVFDHYDEDFFTGYEAWLQRQCGGATTGQENPVKHLFQMGLLEAGQKDDENSAETPELNKPSMLLRFGFKNLVSSMGLDPLSVRFALEFENGRTARDLMSKISVERRAGELIAELRSLDVPNHGAWVPFHCGVALSGAPVFIFITEPLDYVYTDAATTQGLCGETKFWIDHMESQGWKVSSDQGIPDPA